METYQVKIGSANGVYWGEYTAKSHSQLKEDVKASIEVLHPLNSSDDGAEAYRERFRGQPIFIKTRNEKDYKLLE